MGGCLVSGYADIVAGVVARLQTIEALISVLDYEPTAIHEAPAAYVLFDESTVTGAGQRSVRRYRLLVRCVVAWVDNDAAEREIARLVDDVIRVIDEDPQFGGAIPDGMARVVDQQGVFVRIGNTTYRALDSFVEAVLKVPYGS